MPRFIGIRPFVFPIIAAAMAAAPQLATPASAQYPSDPAHGQVSGAQAPDAFQLIGKYTGIGAQLAAVVAPGPTVGSERLYASYIYTGNTFDVLSIDPDTGDTTVFHDPVPGEWGAWGMVAGPDGNVYLGTLPNAHFLKLDTQLGILVDLGRPSLTESYIWSMTFGSDNRLYGGTYPNCKLVRYDPATGQLADLGRLDPAQEYARSVAASKDGFIYAGIGVGTANIAAYQISTGQHQEILPVAAQSVAFPHLYLGTDGNVHGTVNALGFSLSQWTATELKSGVTVPAAPVNVLSDGRTLSITESLSEGGSEILTLVVTNPSTNARVEHVLAYRGEEMELFRVGLGSDGALYGSSAMPANLIRANMGQNSLGQIGVVGSGEIYSFLSHGNSLLMGAYGGLNLATLMSYQPGIPFSQAAKSTNPELVSFRGDNVSWRPEAMINGANGKVYVGALAGYGLIESPLIEWDSASGSVQLFDVVPDQSVVSLAAWHDFIMGGTSSSGGLGGHPIKADAQLFMWNPSTKEVEFQIAPVAGAPTITDLIAAPNGLVYGIAGRTLFEFNPQTRQMTNSRTLPFSRAIYNSVSVDDAGRIWGLAESGIFVIDTTTFNLRLILSSPVQITGGFALGNGNIYFISGPSIYSYTIPVAAAAMTVLPAQNTMDLNIALHVTATVTGTGIAPTGTVTLSGGGYTSPTGTLSGGSYTFTIPANSLNAGTDTLAVSYSGDTNYAPTTGTAAVTVTIPAFTLAASVPEAVAPGSSATSSVTITGVSGYTGTVTLACSLTSAPSGATNLPTCSTDNSTVTLSAGATTSKKTFTVSTLKSTSTRGRTGYGNRSEWSGANGVAVLALLMCLGIPHRRRAWQSMLGILAAIAVLGSLTGCSNSLLQNSSSTGPNNPGTGASAYTFTVTGTSTPSVSPTPTATFTLVVNQDSR